MSKILSDALVIRTAAAQRRLRELQTAHVEKPSADHMRMALKELQQTLEELGVATEQLQAATDDLAQARREALACAERYRDLHEGLPHPCILTDHAACVDEANRLAATLLNVARHYLPGKPLLLFLPDREEYFRLLSNVRETGTASSRALLRPRDRKARPVKIDVTALAHQRRWCWVISEAS
jgi:PAS domain-containing protein